MKLASLFADHAVFQRDIAIPVWGRDIPGTPVAVSLAGNTRHVNTDAEGRFFLRMPPLSAGGPHVLTVSGSTSITARDILIGEVWLCSGQSNMEMPVASARWEEGFPANASHPGIRCFMMQNPAEGIQADAIGTWKVCAPDTVPEFTAVGFAFARKLHKELGCPVGIISNAWGGSRIEAWMERSALIESRWGKSLVEAYEAETWSAEKMEERKKPVPDLMEWARERAQHDAANTGTVKGWASPDFSDHDWPAMSLPGSWQSKGHEYSGVFWFRRTVDVPEAWAGKELLLELGACDKHDITYFNGEEVGTMGFEDPEAWSVIRRYKVPSGLVRKGRNVIAVRVFSWAFDGGMIGPSKSMRLSPVAAGGTPIPLSGNWKFQVEHNLGQGSVPGLPPGPGNHNTPSILFESRICPLVPYAIRGALWYQGETNETNPEYYEMLLKRMIRNWRYAWGEGDFPFLVVQLANHRPPSDVPVSGKWPLIREAQLLALKEPRTGMAVAIDIGDSANVHPTNKNDVGLRLAHWALADTYHKKVVASGPLYSGCTILSDCIVVRFDHCDSGLAAKEGKLTWFALAGTDKKWHFADAHIDGDTVVVRSGNVPHPVAVRYAWADNPEGCSLYNKEGFPASPFRSDDWRV